MNVLRQIAKQLLTTCAGHDRMMLRGPRSRGPRPRIALTFDDGPHPAHTLRLLDMLDEFGIRATFFVIGLNAVQSPDLVRRMAQSGHEIANHTWSHSEPNQTDARTFLEEVKRTDQLLHSLTGSVTTSVRPPKGELNWHKLNGLWRDRKTVALWNVDPKDFRMSRLDEMTEWCRTYEPQDGDIVLLHDNHPYAIKAVEELAAKNVFEKFETTTIRELKHSKT